MTISDERKSRDLLVSASRQYRHNSDNSPSIFNPAHGFVNAYDEHETERIVSCLLNEIADLQRWLQEAHEGITQHCDRIRTLEAALRETSEQVEQLRGDMNCWAYDIEEHSSKGRHWRDHALHRAKKFIDQMNSIEQRVLEALAPDAPAGEKGYMAGGVLTGEHGEQGAHFVPQPDPQRDEALAAEDDVSCPHCADDSYPCARCGKTDPQRDEALSALDFLIDEDCALPLSPEGEAARKKVRRYIEQQPTREISHRVAMQLVEVFDNYENERGPGTLGRRAESMQAAWDFVSRRAIRESEGGG